jgi:hypothetical protein
MKKKKKCTHKAQHSEGSSTLFLQAGKSTEKIDNMKRVVKNGDLIVEALEQVNNPLANHFLAMIPKEFKGLVLGTLVDVVAQEPIELKFKDKNTEGVQNDG